MRRRSSVTGTERTSTPSTRMRPEDMSWMRLIIFSSVVLPLPEEPRITRNSPGATCRLTPATAGRRARGKVFQTSSISMAHGPAAPAPSSAPAIPSTPAEPPAGPTVSKGIRNHSRLSSVDQALFPQELLGYFGVLPLVAVHFPVEGLHGVVGQQALHPVKDIGHLGGLVQQVLANHGRNLVGRPQPLVIFQDDQAVAGDLAVGAEGHRHVGVTVDEGPVLDAVVHQLYLLELEAAVDFLQAREPVGPLGELGH